MGASAIYSSSSPGGSLVKISIKLAHEVQNRLQRVVGFIEAGKIDKAKEEALRLGELVKGQTIVIVDNCEECGFMRAILEPKRGKDETRRT